MAMVSKSGGRQGAAEGGAVGGVGGMPFGCFETRRFHVVSLLGARPCQKKLGRERP